MHPLALAAALMPLLVGAGAPAPRGVAVLVRSREYQDLKQAEQLVFGRLRQTPQGFSLFVLDGLGRAANAIVLHAPGKAHLLTPLLEQNVRVLGKVVPGPDGPRLWPGRIERPGPDAPGVDGVIARVPLPLRGGKAVSRTVQAEVIRTPEALARALGIGGAESASKVTAARMSRAAIDWKSHMIVRIDAGLAPWTRQVAVTRVGKEGGTLVVEYARIVRAGGSDGGFHNAGELALVPRHDGPAVFREARPK